MTIDLDKLEQLHAKTTPGLWSLDPVEYAANDCCWAEGHWDVDGENGGWVVHAGEQPDAEWIVEIHNAAPALIAELREARAAVERVRALAYSFAVGADGEERILEALDGARD
ncbi:hypothetical protein GS474_16010 [Rhodococcus hoagii]|uniref:hypothetical protein n=1 Tax=Rhodococcus hoagii TaxID=43767 RepID=UPI0007CD5659|nr:hypothetical protein [Prescottella equi]NKR60235.1 hypothetical protein [Prescottella equi]